MLHDWSPGERDWERLCVDLRVARNSHAQRSHRKVTALIQASREAYEREVEAFFAGLAVDSATTASLRDALARVRAYVTWLHWVSWNAANLAPLVSNAPAGAAMRLALGTLAYAAGRLVDDGLDGHLTYKERHETAVGAIVGARRSAESLAAACGESVFLGMLVFRYAMRRLNTECPHICGSIEKMFDSIAAAALTELHVPSNVTSSAYRRVIRGKAALYNMLLYRPLLAGGTRSGVWRVLRALYEMDEVAQILNDLKDVDDDRTRGRMNGFNAAVFSLADATQVLRARLVRLWGRTSRLDLEAAGALAAMFENVGIGQLSGPRFAFSPSPIDIAIERGLNRLRRAQLGTGEFRTSYSTSVGMVESTAVESPFATAMIVAALGILPRRRIATMIASATSWLATWPRPDGWVCFLRSGIDPDVDDTCLVSFVLQRFCDSLRPFHGLATEIAAWPRRDGLLVTWRRPTLTAANDVDPCVSANALRLLAQNRVPTRGLAEEVGTALFSGRYDAGTLYYESPAALAYLASANAETLNEVADPARWATEISRLVPRAASVNDVAMTLTLLTRIAHPRDAQFRATAAKLAARLLAAQQDDGGWSPHAMFRAFNYWGSAELTTALALEALAACAAWSAGGAGPYPPAVSS